MLRVRAEAVRRPRPQHLQGVGMPRRPRPTGKAAPSHVHLAFPFPLGIAFPSALISQLILGLAPALARPAANTSSPHFPWFYFLL